MNYPDSVRFLYSLGNEVKTAKLGLERILSLLEMLGNPQRGLRFVHVAGTNGKGSTCAMIESGLRAAGLKTGLFTSPHLVEPTERIRIGGEPVSREEFTDAFRRVHAAAEKAIAAGALELHPTYFETVTAMSFLLFRDAAVDRVVLEVGLGGRLDATNVVIPELCVITPIDFDHEMYLGRSIESIASEKAGILKPGVPAVFAAQRGEVYPVLDARAAECGITPVRAGDCPVLGLELHAYGSRFVLRCPKSCGQQAELRIECPLAGEHQATNAAAAAAALILLGIPADIIERGIRETRWPGRLERVSESPEIILDGAHNPAGARALARHIIRFFVNRRVWMICGAMRDKAVDELASILFPLASELILTAPVQPRAVRPEVMLEIAAHPRARAVPRLQDALDLLQDAAPDDVVFITGSLFLVGEARSLLVE